MRTLHRIIATLLFIALVPATIVAGQMRFCIGEDGHQAVEFAHHPHGSEAQDVGGFRLHTVDLSATTVFRDIVPVLVDAGRCLDLPLVTASLAARSSPHGNSVSQTQPEGSAVVPASVPATPSDWISKSSCQGFDYDIADARLEALRTVVLLI